MLLRLDEPKSVGMIRVRVVLAKNTRSVVVDVSAYVILRSNNWRIQSYAICFNPKRITR